MLLIYRDNSKTVKETAKRAKEQVGKQKIIIGKKPNRSIWL